MRAYTNRLNHPAPAERLHRAHAVRSRVRTRRPGKARRMLGRAVKLATRVGPRARAGASAGGGVPASACTPLRRSLTDGPPTQLRSPDAKAPGPDPHSVQAVRDESGRRFPVTTGGEVTGYRVTQVIGVVSAANVRSRNLMADLWTALAGAFGGEAGYYTHLMNESTSAAMDRAVHRTKVCPGASLLSPSSRSQPRGPLRELALVCPFRSVPPALARRSSAGTAW